MPPAVKTVLPTFELGFASASGQKVIKLDTNKLTGKRCEEISIGIGEIRGRDSDFLEDKYPMNEEESYDDWKKRTGKEANDDNMVRKLGESIDEHVMRLNTPKLSNLMFAFNLLNFYAETSGQKEQMLTEEEFKNAIWQRVREPMYKFFVLYGEIPVIELYPKSA